MNVKRDILIFILCFCILVLIQNKSNISDSASKNINEISNITLINNKHNVTSDSEIILYRPKSNEIQMYSTLPDGKLLITKFVKKLWGTWNIGGWYLSDDGKIPSKSETLIAGGGSDWEYVFRVKDSLDKKNFVFSGGSHGREFIRDLQFIDADTNSRIKINTGDKINIKKFKIIEQSLLSTTFEDNTIYAKANREYVFEPFKIFLTTNIEFTTDIYMGTSYVCMLPVTKEYGRHIWFNGMSNIYSTPNQGETLANIDPYYYIGKQKATSTVIWGDKSPEYILETTIGSERMVDNFSNALKTFYWDINTEANKLYFSKYDNKAPTKIKQGTIWNNSCEWRFNYIPELAKK